MGPEGLMPFLLLQMGGVWFQSQRGKRIGGALYLEVTAGRGKKKVIPIAIEMTFWILG